MSHHFHILDEISSLTLNKEFNAHENSQHKLLLMKIIIKCSDFSSLARPYKVAKKSLPYIADEFFRQGDISKIEEIVYTTDEHIRENINKKESILPFMEKVVLPLFKVLSDTCNMESLYDQLNNNIRLYTQKKSKS